MKLINLRQTALLFLAAAVYLACLGAICAAQTTEKQVWKQGDAVEVEWNGKWFKAKIIEAQTDSYKIHYEGYGENFDESVEPSRVRDLENSAENDRSEIKNKDWTWKDGSGNVRSKAEFLDILRQHKECLVSDRKKDDCTNLTKADLTSAELVGVNLDHAQMSGVNFTEANLIGVSFNYANLSEAKLNKANIIITSSNEANLNGARFVETTLSGSAENIKLSGASFIQSKISGAALGGADLTTATIINSDFSSTGLSGANLSGAKIFQSNFRDVLLNSANLTKALVREGDWSGAVLLTADVTGLNFEPTKNPETRSVAGASNLEFITYGTNPDAIAQLHKNLGENGFEDERRKTNYALKRRYNQINKEQGKTNWYKYIYYYLNLIFFDWTVRYGLEPERALIIIIYLWLIFAVIYNLFIHFPGRSGIFLVKNRVRKNVALTSAIRIRPRAIMPTSRWKYLWRCLKSEWRVFRISLFFSATRALHLGYGGLDLGRWLQMLTKREYEIRPKHWTRSLAGLQSLISLYLIVMWALTEFTNPFN